MKGILITGVTGFVGTSLVHYLEAAKEVMLFGHTRNVNRAKEVFKNNKITIVDSVDTNRIDSLHIDSVIHLAGIAHDLSNQFTDKDYEEVNFENTKVVFDQFLKSGATQFIFLSSIKAAVDTSSIPATEDVVCTPVTAYGKSKRRAEEYLLSCELPDHKQCYILRPCMIHGPGNKGNLNLLYKFVKSGVPYPLGSFYNQRSFLTIDNFNFIISRLVSQPIPSGIYHLSDDDYLSTTELYRIIGATLNRSARILNLPGGLIRGIARLAGMQNTLNKLTESMMVSNKKMVDAIGQSLPVDIRSGIQKTIRSFE